MCGAINRQWQRSSSTMPRKTEALLPTYKKQAFQGSTFHATRKIVLLLLESANGSGIFFPLGSDGVLLLHVCQSCSLRRRCRHGSWCRRGEDSLATIGGTKWGPQRDIERQIRRAGVPAGKRNDSVSRPLPGVLRGPPNRRGPLGRWIQQVVPRSSPTCPKRLY